MAIILRVRILLLHVQMLDEPNADDSDGLELESFGQGIHRAVLRSGFADNPDVPLALKERLPECIGFKPGRSTCFLGQESYRVGNTAPLLDRVRLTVFETMARNASPATAYFHLPPSRVVELGSQVTL